MNAREAMAYLATMPADEPVFVLRAQDKLSDGCVRHWCFLAKLTRGKIPRDKIMSALDNAHDMEQWPDRKFPD